MTDEIIKVEAVILLMLSSLSQTDFNGENLGVCEAHRETDGKRAFLTISAQPHPAVY